MAEVLDAERTQATGRTNEKRTFASRLVMVGVDLYTVQRAGGWKTAVMVQRYANLSPDHMRGAVERLARRGTGTQTGTGAFGVLAANAVGA